MRTAIVYDPLYLKHKTGPGHPELPERLIAILNCIKEAGILKSGKVELVKPRSAKIEQIELVHKPEHVQMVKERCLSGIGFLDPDTPICSDSFEVAKLAAGGILTACQLVLSGKYKNAFAVVRPPGHHARSSFSHGFCIFNNIAVAATYLIQRNFHRIMILDFDAHHGDGTQEIFYSTPKVLYVGLHQDGRTLFPGTGFIDEIGDGEGEGFNINIPFPPKTNDELYLKALNQLALPIARQYKPQMILVSMGFDAHYNDPLTDLCLSIFGYVEAFEVALNLASELCDGKIVAVLEGGYNLKALAEAVVAVIAKMAQLPFKIEDSRMPTLPSVKEKVGDIIHHSRNLLSIYWRTFRKA